MTNWKADPKVQEAREVCFTTDYENHPTRYLDAVCDAVWRAAVAASGSPPSPAPLNEQGHALICEVVAHGTKEPLTMIPWELRDRLRQWLVDVADAELRAIAKVLA